MSVLIKFNTFVVDIVVMLVNVWIPIYIEYIAKTFYYLTFPPPVVQTSDKFSVLEYESMVNECVN